MTDLELYVMGEFDGDASTLASDPGLAEAARFEALLRDAAAAATFCAACDDLVRGERCDACGAAVAPGGYAIERVLVGNAHGRMYVAHDSDGKKVALKELAFVQSPSLDAVAAFEREAKLLRALEHPAIPRFVASFEEGTGVHARYYLAQELVDGTPLDRLDEHWYREDEIVDIARQVLSVLVYLQGLSPMVIHRDIKPANLIKRADNTIAVVDFGAAHVQGNTAGSTTIGTFGYMPIEQLAGIVDATTDVYALGTSLIHLLTRQEPWKTAQAMPVLNVSAQLRAWLAKAAAADPKRRFASAKDALAALDARASVKRRPRWPLIVAAAALVGGGGTFATVHELRGHALTWPMIDAPKQPKEAAHRKMPAEARYHNAQPIDLDVLTADGKKPSVSLSDVVHVIAKQCGLNVVVPDDIRANLVTDLSRVPCDQALESILESQGLWYGYQPDGNVAFVAPRKQLDLEREAARARQRTMDALAIDDALPAGDPVDFDTTLGHDGAMRMRDALEALAAAGHVNLILPEEIQGTIDIRASKAPWHRVLQAVLQANGLWYRYKPDSKILRIAPRKQLDLEAEAELARGGPAPAPRYRSDTLIDLHYPQNAPGKLADVLVAFAQRCDVNLVVPGGINGTVVIDLEHVRCDQGLEALLASNGLWYRYVSDSLLISSRKEIEADRDAEAERARVRAELDVDDTLPPTDKVDIDAGASSIYDAARVLAKAAGINVIVPEGLDGKVTIRAHRMPAGELLQVVLEANGLWYRYEPDGKLMRVASRKDLDAEDRAELARRR